MSKQNTNRIDDYLSGKLAETERLAFEAEMAKDEVLRKEVRLYELERAAAILIAQQHYQKKYGGEQKEEESPSPEEEKAPRKILHWKRYAAAVILLLLLGLFWWVPSTYSNQAILSGEKLEASSFTMKGEGEPETLSREGLNAYHKKDYARAALIFEQQLKDSAAYGKAQYMLAYCKYHLQEYEQSIQLFDKVLEDATLGLKPGNRSKTQWTQLMAYIGKGDLNASFYDRLENLKATGTTGYKRKAQQLENRLNSFWRTFVD